jgi:DNA-directed RNA polymerase I subunit RPA2
MPPPISDPYSFNTLYREWSFRHPTEEGSTVPILDELVAPHIESFNALFDDGGGDGSGLLNLAIKGIGEKVVFDGKDLDENGLPTGNRLSSAFQLSYFMAWHFKHLLVVSKDKECCSR